MFDDDCTDCGHKVRHHLRNGCAVDGDEDWACPCKEPGTGPRNADGSWPAWVNPEARG